jgi:hypothetical protein
MRSTIIMGNGIGLALDQDYFALQSGLKTVWGDTEQLSEHHKELIISAIEDADWENPPTSEEQLDDIQLALMAVDFLNKFNTDELSWVSEQAHELPSAFRKFLAEVGFYFHESCYTLPEEFLEPLCEHIKSTKSHVATLNYDNLLYDAFKDSKVLDGYRGSLIDGFWAKDGFAEHHLARRRPKKTGWYLHLHGSPLFVGNKKLMGADRTWPSASEHGHIVLTNVTHKPLIIESSKILKSYWKHLSKGIRESERLVVFGYSGYDTHLNDVMKSADHLSDVLVVEWSGTGSLEHRKSFWRDITGHSNIELLHFKNILEFTDW